MVGRALAVGLLLATPASPGDRSAQEAAFDRLKPSVVTVEVHPLAGDTKSVLGSGYVAGSEGRIVTNYHVVSTYIEHPDRYRLLVKTAAASFPASLLSFDLINDLALLQAPVSGPPLKLAAGPGGAGAPVIAFGNPEGLGLSLIEGVFNGFAEKGFVDRMLLSMPLNSGMSGGPILNARQEAIGTNVSVMWRSNSLSFGVPIAKVEALLHAPALQAAEAALRRETNRQLGLLAGQALERAVRPFVATARPLVAVGAAQVPRPPEAFECWNSTQVQQDEGLTKTSFQCNLQFTPSLEDVGEVASIEILAEHFASRRSDYGFYAALTDHGSQHHGVEARPPGNGVLSPPECVTDRIRTDHLVWKATTCAYAYVEHPTLGYFALAATSISRRKEAAYVAIHARGVELDAFVTLTRAFLSGVRLPKGPS